MTSRSVARGGSAGAAVTARRPRPARIAGSPPLGCGSFAITRPASGPVTHDAREALLAAILADPSDDAPREVLADKLLDLGDPRGEFILVQLALSRAVPGSEARARLAAASAALEKRYGAAWRRPVAQLTLKQWFRRGFIADVEMRDQACLRDGARLFESLPERSRVPPARQS